MNKKNSQRDYYFDNLKGILIFLVILGHFLLPIETGYLQMLKRWIYIFHMPLFIFVSGYFSKKIYVDGVLNLKKIFFFIKLYFFFVTLIQIVYVVFRGKDFDLSAYYDQSGAPWYLFCLSAWYLMIPLMKKIGKGGALLLSCAAALAAGYFPEIGDVLCLSRIMVFSPFFFLGYFCEPSGIQRILSRKAKIPILVLAAGTTMLFIRISPSFPAVFHLIYGNVAYRTLGGLAMYGGLFRLALGAAAISLSLGIMVLCPRGECALSVVGRNTLPIYIIHRLIRDIIKSEGFYDIIPGNVIETMLILTAISLVLTWLLSRRWVNKSFSRMLLYLRIA